MPWDSFGHRYSDELWIAPAGADRVRLWTTVKVPERAELADVWLFFRWSAKGEVRYIAPTLTEVPPPQTRKVRVSLVTGPLSLRDPSTARDLDFHLRLTEKALADSPDFVGYPEVITSGTIPGRETEAVCRIAADNRITIGLPMYELEGGATYNSAILIGPTGDIIGKYRKVHPAYPNEMMRGIAAGFDFPVYDTPVGRIGMNICMDESVPESAMMVAVHGAEMLFLPIMGDLRAEGRGDGHSGVQPGALPRGHALPRHGHAAIHAHRPQQRPGELRHRSVWRRPGAQRRAPEPRHCRDRARRAPLRLVGRRDARRHAHAAAAASLR